MNKIRPLIIHNEQEMSEETSPAVVPASDLPTFLAQDIIAAQANLSNAVQQLARLQIATTRATFEAMPLEQRDRFCQSLESSGYSAKQIAAITEKSQPTVSRHLNGKNS